LCIVSSVCAHINIELRFFWNIQEFLEALLALSLYKIPNPFIPVHTKVTHVCEHTFAMFTFDLFHTKSHARTLAHSWV
jgi:hypothetical protein